MRTRSRILIAFLLLLISLHSLSYSQVNVQPKDEIVLAKVGDQSITTNDFKQILRQSFPMSLFLYKGQQGKERLLRELVDQELFAQEARKEGMAERPEIKKRIAYATSKILSDAYIERAMSTVKAPSELELEAYYAKHQSKFLKPERLKLRCALFATETEAKKALELVRQGESFTKVSEGKECPSETAGTGEDGWIEKGSAPAVIQEVAFSLSEGQVSEIFRIDQGYCILKAEEKPQRGGQMFFEVKERIRQQVSNEQREEVLAGLREKLEMVSSVEVHPERLTLIPEMSSQMTDEEFFRSMQQSSFGR